MGKSVLTARKLLILFVLLLCASLVFPTEPVLAKEESTFGYPLKNHTVAKGFIAPAFEYGPGHRGVSFLAKPGTSVYASADGQVIFAGKVANKLHITLSHGSEFRTTYTNLQTKTVTLGEKVTRGQLIGTTGVGVNIKESNTFLFTMRQNAKYVDPMQYLESKSVVREINLAEFEKRSKSLIQEIADIEKNVIQNLIGEKKLIKEIEDFKKFVERKGVEQLKKLSENAKQSWQDVISTIDEMKELLKKIASDTISGFEEGIKSGTKKLKALEKKLVEQLKLAFEDLKKLSKILSQYYSKALEISIDSAKWFLEAVVDIAFLPLEMSRNLALLVSDFLGSVGTTTLKLLNQYATYDMEKILRTIIVPGSCMLESCAKSIVLKCDRDSGFRVRIPGKNYVGSGNNLLVVAGLGTSAEMRVDSQLQPSLDLPTNLLGYTNDEVEYLSYSPSGGNYADTDTYSSLEATAESMDKQIRKYKIDNPGKKLDIVTHSLGGALTALWLSNYYDSGNPAYPQIGKVIMLAPPTNGTALATGREILEMQNDGQALVDGVASIVPRVSAKSVEQVKENGHVSDVVKEKRPLSKVEIITIRSAPDLIVTAATDPTPDGNEVVFPSSNLFNSHSGITKDIKAVSTMQHFLEGSPTPCPGVKDSLMSIIQASSVRSGELYIARNLRDGADVTNLEDVSGFISSIAS